MKRFVIAAIVLVCSVAHASHPGSRNYSNLDSPTFTNLTLNGYGLSKGSFYVGTSIANASFTVNPNGVVVSSGSFKFTNTGDCLNYLTSGAGNSSALYMGGSNAPTRSAIIYNMGSDEFSINRKARVWLFNDTNGQLTLEHGNTHVNVTTATATGDWQMPNNVSVGKTATMTNVNFSSGTVTSGLAIGSSVGGIYTLKGISCTAVLKLTTPALYDVWYNTDTFKLYIASAATPCGFKASAAFGATD